jgi:hypothetical protein
VYAICVAALVAIASGLLLRTGARTAEPAPGRRVDLPPGPCTVPPCLPEDVSSARG